MRDAPRWVLIAVFTLSAVEKGSTLWWRSAAWHPVMLANEWRRQNATAIIGLALAVDVLIVGLLCVQSQVGAGLATLTIVVYSFAAKHLAHQGNESCRCFFKLLNTRTRLSFAVRNGTLVLLAVIVFAYPSEPSLLGVASAIPVFLLLMFLAWVMDRGAARVPLTNELEANLSRASLVGRVMTMREGKE